MALEGTKAWAQQIAAYSKTKYWDIGLAASRIEDRKGLQPVSAIHSSLGRYKTIEGLASDGDRGAGAKE